MRSMKNIFLTGRPGVGKTTIVKESVDIIKEKGFIVGGMTSSEIRVRGIRVGFEITDILTGRKGILAHIEQKEGPQVSKYRVKLSDLVNVGVSAIKGAIEKADLVVIDEVGPMELYSSEFKEAVIEAIGSRKLVLGTIHYKARDPLIDRIKSDPSILVIEATLENRARLAKEIADRLLEFLHKWSA